MKDQLLSKLEKAVRCQVKVNLANGALLIIVRDNAYLTTNMYRKCPLGREIPNLLHSAKEFGFQTSEKAVRVSYLGEPFEVFQGVLKCDLAVGVEKIYRFLKSSDYSDHFENTECEAIELDQVDLTGLLSIVPAIKV